MDPSHPKLLASYSIQHHNLWSLPILSWNAFYLILVYYNYYLPLSLPTSSSLLLLSRQLFQYCLELMNEAQKQENLEHIHGLLDLFSTQSVPLQCSVVAIIWARMQGWCPCKMEPGELYLVCRQGSPVSEMAKSLQKVKAASLLE